MLWSGFETIHKLDNGITMKLINEFNWVCVHHINSIFTLKLDNGQLRLLRIRVRIISWVYHVQKEFERARILNLSKMCVSGCPLPVFMIFSENIPNKS